MTAIVPFIFDDMPLRWVIRDGQPWFVLADACAMLDIKNPSMAARPLDETERAKHHLGRQGEATVVSVPGLLLLLVRSRSAITPGTKAFRVRKWITGDVIPQVLHTGSYGAPAPQLDLSDAATLQRLLLDHTGGRLEAEQRVAELEPKVAAFDRLTDAAGALGLRATAKALKMGERQLIAWLDRNEWIFRPSPGARWKGYRRRVDAGLITHRTIRIRQPDGPDKSTHPAEPPCWELAVGRGRPYSRT